jgi:hypothetical protein
MLAVGFCLGCHRVHGFLAGSFAAVRIMPGGIPQGCTSVLVGAASGRLRVLLLVLGA